MLSSYQVLDRLPEEVRGRLIEHHGGAGSGGGGNRGAAHAVAQALEMLERRGEATATYLDTQGVQFRVAGEFIEGGYGLGLSADDDGDRPLRAVGRIGIRLKL